MLNANSLFAMTKIEFTDSPIIFVHDYEDDTPTAKLVEYLNENLDLDDLEGFDVDDLLEYGSAEMLIPALDEYLDENDLYAKHGLTEDQELVPLHIMDVVGKGYIISVATVEGDADADDDDDSFADEDNEGAWE